MRRQVKLSPGPLLNERGELSQAGYATSLVKEYDRKLVRGGRFRIKEWDYYLIHNSRYGVALTLDDNSYMGLVSISFLDFEKRTEHTASPMTLFPMGKTGFPKSSGAGDVSLEQRNMKMSFRHEGGRRILDGEIQRFENSLPIRVHFELTKEPEDSMVIATPFPKKKTAFYYNQKIIGMRAMGKVEYAGCVYEFKEEDSFALLDWGRGVWTYDNTWYWSAAMGMCGGEVFGFNLGYGFGDTSEATENMLFYKGRAHKLDEVRFLIPGEDVGKIDYLKPWTFTSSDKRLELSFTPILDRKAYTSAGLILSDQHQVFGYFDGEAVLDDGTRLLVNHMLGFAEKVRNKW
ncbi:MAG: DUF2804 domain-containing protein [Lachnospiraceae bacterium]|jgi:hypothetical protein|nr:DUF2804 domain-containing protein [Lachnospiraceae bacterium]